MDLSPLFYTMMILTVLIIGASGLIAQVVILRELLVNFYGNELTIGIILANWMLLEAGGVYLVGRLIGRIKEKTSLFLILQLVFVWGFMAAVYFSRTFKSLNAASFGQGLNLGSIYLYSFLAIFLVGFSHGALFAVSCRIFQRDSDQPFTGIGKVYTWETVGTIISGILLTYILIPLFNSFQLARLLAVVNLAVALMYIRPLKSSILRFAFFFSLLISLIIFFRINPDRLQDMSLRQQFKSDGVVDYRNTLYGNIAVIRDRAQTTLFYNGIPAITAPYPDTAAIEEFGNLPLLFHPDPQKILLIGSGMGGLIQEILKHPVTRLDYLEIDAGIQEALKAADFATLAAQEKDPRVRVVNQDSRLFLLDSKDKYDLILLGSTGPVDLVSNRLFTEEFFGLAKVHLENEGIIAFRLSGSLSYLSKQLRDLNFSIINSLKIKFAQVRVLPGDLNLILGSDSRGIVNLDAREINRRIRLSGLQTKTLVPAYLEYRMNQRQQEWFNASSLGATRKNNRDFIPIALFQSLLMWNRQFSPAMARVFESLSDFDLSAAAAAILVIFLIFLAAGKGARGKSANLALLYCLGSSGFWAMTANLELVFGFQISFGYIYKTMGLLIAVFMAGMALASAVTAKSSRRAGGGGNLKYLLAIEIAMVIFSVFLSWVITGNIARSLAGLSLFILLFFTSGYFLGAEFVLCAEMYRQKRAGPGNIAASLYSADLFGGCLAGFLAGVWMLPVLGIWGTGLLLSLIKATSFALLKKNVNNG
jgi:spermidine synthase